eukprot:g254.t1
MNQKIEAIDADADGSLDSDRSRMQTILKENATLKRQIHEMETFLADYGLIWVGYDQERKQKALNEGKENESTSGDERTTSSTVNDGVPEWLDFPLLCNRLRELSCVAARNTTKIVKQGKHHRFQKISPIQIELYQDGVMVVGKNAKGDPLACNKVFRPYTDSSTQLFLNDILDGFFPSEFKDTFPDGVEFETKNYSNCTYAQSQKEKGVVTPFAGVGKNLHDTGENFSLSAIGDSRMAFDSQTSKTSSGEEKSLSVGTSTMSAVEKERLKHLPQTLDQIPEVVISNGCVVKVRAAVKEMFAVHRGSTAIIQTKALKEIEAERKINATNGGASNSTDLRPMTPSANITTLRIRVPRDISSKTSVILVKLWFTDSVGTLYENVKTFLEQSMSITRTFEIRSTFPKRTYIDKEETLRDAGLVPNAALVLTWAGTK